MSDTDHQIANDDDSAAEYALHLMAPAERAAFEQRLTVEPALAAKVDYWHAKLAPLADEIVPVAPPLAVQKRIEAALFGASKPRLVWWRWLAGGLVAAALGIAVLQPNLFSPAAPIYIAELADEGRSLVVVASLNAASGALVVTRQSGVVAAGRDQELWIILPNADAPISLGVLASAQTEILLPDELRGNLIDVVLAISDEPLGGSPTGAPTGAILVAGPLTLG